MHNLRGCDVHLIAMAVRERHGSVRVIPNNMEKYIAFSVGQVQFLDSFQFTMKSLDSLAQTIHKEDFIYTKQLFSEDEEFKLMTRRGVLPYDFFDSLEKLDNVTIPSRQSFFNSLNNQECHGR